MGYVCCVLIGLSVGITAMQWLHRKLLGSVEMLTKGLDWKGEDLRDVLQQRRDLLAMLSRFHQKQNPGEPEPDWLVVAQSGTDYDNGDWRTADEVLEELEANDGQLRYSGVPVRCSRMLC